MEGVIVMEFIDFLKSTGKIDNLQAEEVLNIVKINREKIGRIILKKHLLPKHELIEQLQMYINNSA